MRRIFRWAVSIVLVFSAYLFNPAIANTNPLKFSSSTQFLWGDDLLGNSQSIIAQYLRLSYTPEAGNLSVTGYGRVWQDFNNGPIRDNNFLGRLYYLYLDYTPVQDIALRLGRQYMTFTAQTSLMDGARVDIHNIGPLGVTVAGGRTVVYSLDSEYSASGNIFWGVDLHLEKIRTLQLGVSYAMVYDEYDRAREELGLNFRWTSRYVSPYAEIKYDYFSKTMDQGTVGVNVFPLSNVLVKAEFYQSYPTFDTTSIYSVFAVDQYREYTIQADYSLDAAPVTVYAAYAKQTYEDSDNADRFTVGAKVFPLKNLNVNASIDYRDGYGGNLWGFEVTADYHIKSKL